MWCSGAFVANGSIFLLLPLSQHWETVKNVLHNVMCINPLTTCLAPVELTVWAFLSPQRTCYMFWNFHGLDFFFLGYTITNSNPCFSMKNIMNSVSNISCLAPQSFWTIHTFYCIGSIYLWTSASKRNKFLAGLYVLVLFRKLYVRPIQ